MSGSNDPQLQMLMLQMRQQQRQPSTQSRLAQAMMQANMQQAQTPVWGTGATLARAGSGVLAGLMGSMAERADQQREERMLQQVQDRAEKRDYLQNEEAAAFGQRFGLVPAAAPQDGTAPPAQTTPNWRAAALEGLGSSNPAIQRQAQAALAIGQLEDQQAARQEQARLARELAVASRPPRAPEELVVVQTPEGPRYVPRSQAAGREPARTPQPGGGGPFQGSAMDAQALNILLSPNADPTSPAYAAAFNQVYGPRTVTQADGSVVTIQPQAPNGIRPPAMAPAAPPVSTPAPEAPQVPAQAAPVVPAPVAQAAPARAPTVTPEVTQTPGATVTRVPGTGGTLTEGQSKANMFGLAMTEGHNLLENLARPNDATIIAWRNAPESLVNMTLSENDQQYFNALRQFAAGVLRKETGAAFSANELLDLQSRFFPMPGDTVATQRQKARARLQAIEAMRNEMPAAQFRGQLPPATPGATAPSGGRVIQYDAQGRRVQ